MQIVGLLESEHRSDIRVVEGRQHLRFPPEASETIVIVHDGLGARS
jgi:hypothetical protein